MSSWGSHFSQRWEMTEAELAAEEVLGLLEQHVLGAACEVGDFVEARGHEAHLVAQRCEHLPGTTLLGTLIVAHQPPPPRVDVW